MIHLLWQQNTNEQLSCLQCFYTVGSASGKHLASTNSAISVPGSRWQHAVSKSQHCHCYSRDALSKLEVKAAQYSVPDHYGSRVALCCSQSGTLSSFDALTLLNGWQQYVYIGTCESAVCVRIESGIKSGIKIRIRIESFQLQQILIIKISNYKWSNRDVQNYIIPHYNPQTH